MTKNASHEPTLRPLSKTHHSDTLLRGILPDMYFVNTPAARIERHCEVLENLGRVNLQEQPLLLFHDTPGVGFSELTFCAWDDSAPGLLAKLCGTMAALKISIHTAFIYTFRDEKNLLGHFEAPETARAIALDTFLVSESYFRHDRALSSKTKKRLQSELSTVLRGENSVRGLLKPSRLRSFVPLELQELRCENRPQDQYTRLSLRATDKPGVLFRTTSALATMGLNICVAQISTREAAVNDIFFLTDANGQRLPDFQLSTIEAQLRAHLQDSATDTLFDCP